MGRFWIDNNFIREDARYLSVYAQSVYSALACHANIRGETFIGCRKIGTSLGINKDTANKAINELIAYGRVRRLNKKIGRASLLKIMPVPNKAEEPSYGTGHKEDIKEISKDSDKSANFEQIRKTISTVKQNLLDKGIYRSSN